VEIGGVRRHTIFAKRGKGKPGWKNPSAEQDNGGNRRGGKMKVKSWGRFGNLYALCSRGGGKKRDTTAKFTRSANRKSQIKNPRRTQKAGFQMMGARRRNSTTETVKRHGS